MVGGMRGNVDFRVRVGEPVCSGGRFSDMVAGVVLGDWLVRYLLVLLVCVGVFGFCGGVARASVPRLISGGSFPATLPVGVAVDQSSDDVYTAAFFLADINKFDASGGLISPPSPFGEGNFSSVAVNPVNGDVYVLSASEPTVIDTYDPGTGALLSSFEVPASKNEPYFGATFVQIGVDSAGDVYVPVAPANEVLEYDPATCPAAPTPCVPLHTFTGGSGALKGPTGVAVDSSGNLWVADTGSNRIEELDPAGNPVEVDGNPVEIKSEGVQDAIALDGHDDVLAIVKNDVDFCGSVASPCSHLVEYDAAGVQVADVGAGSFEFDAGACSFPNCFPLPPMVAVDEATGRVYVTDANGKKVWVFAPPALPRVEKELSTEVGTSEAKLGALVNPGGVETSYRFEYGTTTAYGQRVPLPEGSIGEGLTSRVVWAGTSGLAPGTTYHYRVVATNELGPPVVGPDQTFTTHAGCPNEALRGGFSVALPDCRAYELVTATTDTSVQIEGSEAAAPDGDAIAFKTKEPLPGAPTGGDSYVARRGVDGWSSEDLIPLESYTGAVCVSDTHSNEVPAFSDELSRALLVFGRDTRASEPGGSQLEKQECNAEGLQVVEGEPVGYKNLLLRDNATGAYRLVNPAPPGVTPADANFKGASSDLSHVVFGEQAPLTSGASAGVEDMYESDEGVLRLLTVLPDGAPTQGSLAQASNGSPAISADGSCILFTSASGGALYARIDGERTVQVDESQGPGVSGGGSFQAVSVDGSKVLFLDENRLTSDSTAAAGAPDLYECALPKGASRCELTDLTVAKTGEHADVLSVSTLGSEDSSHVYFVAEGVLAANKREYTDSEGNNLVEEAESGQDNLYLWDGGTTTFIATITDPGVGRVSPDGEWFEFGSRKSLTGYDNGPSNGSTVNELFLYDAGSKQLVCASCNPSGEAPIAGVGGRTLCPLRSVHCPTVAACSSKRAKGWCHRTRTTRPMCMSTRMASCP